MAFDIVANFKDKVWLDEVTQKLDAKMRYGVKKALEVESIPYTTENGQWKETRDIFWWTNGFWPASMWQMYLMTGEELYRDEAIRTEKMMDACITGHGSLGHDTGMMWLIQSGVRYALERNEDSRKRTYGAVMMLSTLYNPNGFIRAWNGRGREGYAIIDCMMNLPLLYWASEEEGDPRYRLMAINHADTALKHFVREDGSCNHIVIFNPETGEVVEKPRGQGYAVGSSWSRGQAWGLYGFTLSYLCSGKKEYLDAAKRIAHYFIANVMDDYLPRCDFRQPEEPDVRDDAGAGCAICGLLELCQQVPEHEAKFYYDAAIKMLKAMEREHANWTESDPAILTHCTPSYHERDKWHMTMNYADYFFIEAINKLRGEKRLFWRPYEFQK